MSEDVIDLLLEMPAILRRSSALRPMHHKRSRRTQIEMAEIRFAIYEFAERMHPVGVRQTFYAVETQGLVPKTEAGARTVGRLMVEMRKSGALPYHWVVDGTRFMYKPPSHDTIEQAVTEAAKSYRLALWSDTDRYIEIWVEKQGLISTLLPVTSEWDIPLMPAKGFPSLSFLYDTAMHIEYQDRPCFIYYLGDSDKAGRDAVAFAERTIREHVPDADLTFELLAVTDQQIRDWQLPTRPPKARDRAVGMTQCVELDAIPPDRLRQLVRDAIETHIGTETLIFARDTEQMERATFAEFMQTWGAFSENRA